ncbi:MAG: TonB-dependent siderophore receptor [Rhodocyclales bacterium]|nr:TonB-dependent siderophore receptor [Rhodocyclales bacterium]
MSFRIRIKPVALAVIAACGAIGQLHAADTALPQVNVQDQTERADGPVKGYRATRSSTFTKTDTPLKDVPASVSVVPEALIKDQAMQSLADVIRYVPGALAHQGEGNRDEFILRGIGTSANLYVDGIRDDAQVFRDLYSLERVEFFKGAGGMIFGRGAGGVVNRVTKKPVFAHIGEASVTLGQNSQLRGTVDLGGKLNDSTAWRLNAMAESSDSFRNGADLKRYAINPTVTLVPGAMTSLTLGFEHLRDERTADRGFPSQNGLPFNADPSTFFGNADQSKAHSYIDSAYAILDHDFGAVQLKNNLRITHYDKYYQNVFPTTTTAVSGAGNVSISAYNNANQRTNIFNQTDLTTKLTAGGFEHTLLAGLELGHQDSTNLRNTGFFGAATTILVPASNPVAAATSFRQNGTDANNKVKAAIAAVYLQDQIALSKEWKLLAGLRYDYFKVSLDDRRTTTPAVDLAHTDKEFSPRLGLIWAPTSTSTYYASYSYSFLPSAETLGLAVNTADLDPENAKNYEIGGRWDLLPNLTLSTALFRLDRNNVRNADGLGGIVLTGQQRTDGVEVGLQGDITRNWQIYAGYAHLDSRITKATAAAGNLGHRPQLVPENTLSLWNKLALGGNWSAGLGVVYQGASYPNADNLVTLPAFTRADGALYYAFADGKTRLALNVENLFDKKYFPTADANNNISPGAPRNARLTLSTRF